jgi:hypothetical protein
VEPPPAGTFKDVSVGSYDACAVGTDGSLVYWSVVGFLQEEIPGRVDHPPPGNDFVQVSSGQGYACAVTSEGKLWCWGNYARQPL